MVALSLYSTQTDRSGTNLIQSNVGSNTKLLEDLASTMCEAAHVLNRKIIRRGGAEAITKIVLSPKAKYSLVLSNATIEEISKLERKVMGTLCQKFGLTSNVRHSALYGDTYAMGWHRWADIVNECKLKLVVEAIKNPDSMMGTLVNGAIENLQNEATLSKAAYKKN